MGLKRCLRDIRSVVSPSKYGELSNRSFADAFLYFCFYLFIGVIIFCIFMIPFLFSLSSHVDAAFDSFEVLTFNGEIKTIEPIVLGPLTIDTNAQGIEQTGILMTDAALFIKIPGKTITLLFDVYKNPIMHQEEISDELFWIGLLFVPYFMFTLFMVTGIAIFIISFVCAVFMALARGIFGRDARARSMIKVSWYASPMLSLTLFIHHFSLPKLITYGLPLFLYICLLGLVFFSLSMDHHHPIVHVKKKTHKKPKKQPPPGELTSHQKAQLHKQLQDKPYTQKKKAHEFEHAHEHDTNKDSGDIFEHSELTK